MGIFRLRSESGLLGEKLGCRYLEQKGYRILERNYCNTKGKRIGEIDIVAEKDKMLVFVEVKTRIRSVPGETMLPEENITREKLRKLERIAACYLREHRRESAFYRFDALSIVYDVALKKASVRHLESVFL